MILPAPPPAVLPHPCWPALPPACSTRPQPLSGPDPRSPAPCCPARPLLACLVLPRPLPGPGQPGPAPCCPATPLLACLVLTCFISFLFSASSCPLLPALPVAIPLHPFPSMALPPADLPGPALPSPLVPSQVLLRFIWIRIHFITYPCIFGQGTPLAIQERIRIWFYLFRMNIRQQFLFFTAKDNFLKYISKIQEFQKSTDCTHIT